MSSEAHSNEASTPEPDPAPAAVTTCACATCGGPRDPDDQHWRFTLPDPVRRAPDRELTPGTWMSGDTAHTSELMMVPNHGAYARALLPIRLTEGYSMTYAVWLMVHPNDWRRLCEDWWSPEYADLRIYGWLANNIEPWDVLTARVTAVVRDPEQIPYCDSSPEERLDRVLHEEWPQELLLKHT
ncbi:DUF2199 domain-containing protein [Nocardia altamirensis]|uniref:DUF2199 domain-containing protein n=1 Tax=Nocardia altamirensis TaxID=472158 RepID=UPI0014354B1D|nr:DUF2199 domain-containing protein [Nocardia altamirensis]